ncbi:MAG: hypothetical protein BWY45_03060 [Euryarchaeota archaeon ADurb.Bin294]|nr:MAG: hypothetical protein BWY45_03060 [Euryarchaeota archaeon ADurb.Bin294]
MDIISDWGTIFPASIVFGDKTIAGFNGGRVSYSDPLYTNIIQRIMEDYKPDGYDYIPNLNQDAAMYVKSRLIELGYPDRLIQVIFEK